MSIQRYYAYEWRCQEWQRKKMGGGDKQGDQAPGVCV